VPSATLLVLKTTAPVNPLTETTASVLSIFCQAVPLYIAQSPIFHSLIPFNVVEPATLTT
jgi:hypothetical protein